MIKNIVLLHGWGASVHKLGLLKESLESKGWKVYVPKIPGFDAPPPSRVWNLSDYSLYVKKEADKKFIEGYFLLGHSFGGRITIKLASADNTSLKGVILCASGGISRGSTIKRYLFLIIAKTGKVLNVFPPFAKLFRRLVYKLARERDYLKTSGTMKDTFKNVIEENLKPLVEKISKPALVLWGKEDKMTPIKDAYFIRSKLKNVKLVEFENQGHRLPYEDPKGVSLEIEKWYKLQK